MTPRRKRVLRWTLAPLLLLLLALVGAWLFLTSDAGGELVRTGALEAINAQLKGRIEVKSLTTAGGLIVLDGLKLFTPEGELVAEIAHAELDPRLLSLASGDVSLWSLKIVEPRFYLKTDERGLNLSRAVESKFAGLPGRKKDTRLRIEIAKVALDSGYFDFAFGTDRYTVQQIHIEGKANVSLMPALSLLGDLHLGGHVTAPLVDVLNLDVAAQTANPGEVVMELLASTSDTHVRGQLSLDPVKLVVTDSVASPMAVRAFAPGFKLKVPISTRGVVSPAAIDVTAEAGSARVAAKANFPKEGLIDALELHASGVDLAELIEGGRTSQLAADLTGKLNAVGLDTFDGALKGQARWNEGDRVLASADLDVLAVKGTLEVKTLDAKAPGARLNARGGGDRKAMKFAGSLNVSNLHSVAEAIAGFTGTEVLPMSGQGSLVVALAGPLLHPAVGVHGGFTQLRLDTVQVSGLEVNAQLADVRRPLEAQAQLSAARVQLGETVLEGLNVETSTAGRAVKATLTTKGLATLALAVGLDGTVDKDNQGILVSGLTVEYPKVLWTLEAPVQVGWTGEGDVTAGPLALRAEDQRAVVEGSLVAKKVTAAAHLENLDLNRLPRALVPRELQLTGRVDADATARGPLARVESDLKLVWREGTVQGLTGISLTAQAHLAEERVAGTLAADTSLGHAGGDFSLPLTRKSGKPQPVAVHLTASALELSRAAAAFGAELPVEGTVNTRLDVDGTLEQPRPNVRIESGNLRLCRGPCTPSAATRFAVESAVVSLESDAEHRPVAVVNVDALGGNTRATVKLPLTFAQLLEAYLPIHAKKAEGLDWQQQPFSVDLRASKLNLPKLFPALDVTQQVKGTLSVEAMGTGTLQHPNVDAMVTVAGLQPEGVHPLELTAALSTNRDDSRITLDVQTKGKPVLVLTGRLGGPLERVKNDADLMETGLLVDAEVGPVQVADLVLPVEGEDAPPSGTLRAQVAVKGTGAAPRASMRGTVEGLKVGKVALGQANLTWDYEAYKHLFGAAITSAGKLKAKGELTLDISVPALRKGIAAGKAPLLATVDASDFDLQVFSGAHPMVRTLGGLLKLDVKVEGELAHPGFEGKVEWTQGRLGVAGFGDYRDVHLLLWGDNAGYVLGDLSASAGAGQLKLDGKALRVRPGVFSLTSDGTLTKFPLITDDQLLAIASANVKVDGEASPGLIDLKQVAIPEAHVELPDVKRKDLQDLERPGDIILVRNGVPLKKKKKKLGAAEENAAAKELTMLRVTLDAPRNLWVKSSDVNLELGLSEKFRIEYTDRPLIYGEANVIRGRIDVIGRRFDMQKNSQVRFNGPGNQPYLNVTAVHVNQREAVTVFVNVVGRGKDASLKLSSQPSLPDSELLILLTTGRRTLKRGGGSSVSGADAASVLGSVAASQLKSMVAKRLPLDVLSIESGTKGIEDASLEAGIYLSDRIYLGYMLQLGAQRSKGENGNSVKLEYQISKSWSFDANAGDAPAVGAELVWSRDY